MNPKILESLLLAPQKGTPNFGKPPHEPCINLRKSFEIPGPERQQELSGREV